jgi:4-amino-4-deoxy-L-arabinose transferase-like glycosyltransferase
VLTSRDPSARLAYNNVMAALTAVIAAAWILPGLLGHDPWKPDEAYTFGLVYHLLQGGSWVVPTLAGETFVEHPPLFILTAAALARLFADFLPLHDGARLASGVYMALAFGFIAAAGRELHGPNRGWVTTLLVIGCFGLAVRAHQMIPDTALFAAFAMGAHGLVLMMRRARAGGFWLGMGAGMGFMAKGLLAPVVLGLTAVALALVSGEWRSRRTAVGGLWAIGVALPWFIVWPAALYSSSPELFAEWLRSDALVRAVIEPALASQGASLLYFLSILPWYAWPVLPLVLWVLWGTRYSRFARPQVQLPVLLFAVCLGAIAVSGDARELHAMPLLIALGLLATPAVDTLRRGASNAMYWFGVMGFSFFALVAWVYWSALDVGIPQRLSLHLHKLRPDYAIGFRWWALLLGALYTAGWIALLSTLKRRVERPIVVWAAGSALIWGLLMVFFVPYADVSKSYRGMIGSLTRALPPFYDCISSRALAEPQRAMLHYQAGIITYREEIPERRRSCELLLVQGQRSEPPEIPPGWHQIWEGTRPGEKEEYFWLYGYGPPPSLQ